MAKGRKTDKPSTAAPASDKSSSNGSSARSSTRATNLDVVETVRGLAAVIAEHSLSELIVDLPDATITLRRGVSMPMAVGPAMMPGMPQLAQMQMPMQMPQIAGMSAPSAGAAIGSAASAPEPAAPHDNAHIVTSPFVGTFYRRPNPDSPNYVQLNDRVDKGQVLCIVEAMKLMNEIEADVAGTVVGVLVEDGAPVEYGQALFKIAPG